MFLGDDCPVTDVDPDGYYEFFYHPSECGIITHAFQNFLLFRTKILYFPSDGTMETEMPVRCVTRRHGVQLCYPTGRCQNCPGDHGQSAAVDSSMPVDSSTSVDYSMLNSRQQPYSNEVHGRHNETGSVTQQESRGRIHTEKEDMEVASATQSGKNVNVNFPCVSNDGLHCKRRNWVVCLIIEKEFGMSTMFAQD
ncbi:putative oocyte-secreted protein 1 homolog [Nycticebus coucang]|uniref:putative oocyte-secreted protein 1 homolog n=1 Tax=Nycticebus coucang TaxID=9470 RepID=UPI00234D26A0|nr:putative oocyte-secreted protein 1 homolog [Nycticebus coucang]XP_053415708.1 putative oocyte-secreted protein 1 homolog [Nycticebus coucang]